MVFIIWGKDKEKCIVMKKNGEKETVMELFFVSLRFTNPIER
jgi:hypothetical protein